MNQRNGHVVEPPRGVVLMRYQRELALKQIYDAERKAIELARKQRQTETNARNSN